MILAWVGAALIGLSLGLLGSGGSILTVPVLVYLVGESEKLAIAESLAIVGAISLVGALSYALRGQVRWNLALLFGLPGIVGTFAGSALSRNLSGGVQLSLFAAVMLVSATFMLRSPLQSGKMEPPAQTQPPVQTAAQGLGVGVLTGVVGVGGGFLIIPALVLLGGLGMEYAVGTSLVIITLNSLTGFLKHLTQLSGGAGALDWKLIALFAGVGIVGNLAGVRLSRHIPAATLKRGFGVFLIAMGGYVLATNLPKVL